ncbi:MAG: hypothetical protein CMK00_01030 [Planctomycetes bacterium]|nr:hypothetical protein [Planctomycetota bacterium]HJO27466.1 hypothetical protein [Planctomycetota bacterium]
MSTDPKTLFQPTRRARTLLLARLVPDESTGLAAAEGQVQSITSREMILTYRDDEQTLPAFPLGLLVTLEVRSPYWQAGIKVEARIERRRDRGGQRRYILAFTRPEEVESDLAPALQVLFSQRAAYRVRPLEAEPVTVGLTTPEGASFTDLTLNDISADGLSLRVGSETEVRLAASTRVTLAFTLGGRRLEFSALIVERHMAPRGIHLGMYFLKDETPNFLERQEAVMDFVVERQRQDLEGRVI